MSGICGGLGSATTLVYPDRSARGRSSGNSATLDIKLTMPATPIRSILQDLRCPEGELHAAPPHGDQCHSDGAWELEDVRRRNLAVLGGCRCIKKRIWAAKMETPACDFPALSASEPGVMSPSQPFRLWVGAVRT